MRSVKRHLKVSLTSFLLIIIFLLSTVFYFEILKIQTFFSIKKLDKRVFLSVIFNVIYY